MGSDCCGPPAELDAPPTAASTANTTSCQDYCCSSDDKIAEPLEISPDQGESSQEKPNDCCSSGKCDDDKAKDDPATPDCCRGKASPCCDSSCLDRLAMRECSMSATTAHGEDPQSGTCSGAAQGKACGQHSTSTFDRYGATLRALGCICRALIALGQETCCEPRARNSLGEDRRSENPSARSLRRPSLDSCCSSASITPAQAAQNRLRVRKTCSGGATSAKKPSAVASPGSCCPEDNCPKEPVIKRKCSRSSSSNEASAKKSPQKDKTPLEEVPAKHGCASSCCSGNKSVKAQPVEDSCAKSCCSAGKPIKLPTSKCSGGCCGMAQTAPIKENLDTSYPSSCCKPSKLDSDGAPTGNKKTTSIPAILDIEKQGDSKEHVVLSVSGMTCTGCETKLNRTLATVPAVQDLKTSLVLSRAEFTIDLRLSSVAEVVKHLERTTEFRCERVQNQGSSLDLIIPNEPSNFVSQTWPEGVIDMALVHKQTVRVVFDAKIVGARDLVEKIWGPPIELAQPCGDPSLEAGSKHVRHVGYTTLLSAILTIPVLVMAWAPLPERELAYFSASLALATIVQGVIAGPFYPKALKALIFSRVIEMDLLIVLSTSAAYIFSVVSFGYFVAGKPLSTGQFFETSTLLVTLIMVGRWVAALARQRAVESISIRSLQASTATLVNKDGGTDREIDARLLQYGDTFKVLPESRIPTDGTVVTGSSEVDESMLTGESKPVEKHPKSVVIAGSINGPGVMTVRLNRLPGDNTIHAIAAMVDEAKLSKPKLQDLADRVASYFVPVVVALTIITFVIWVALGMTVHGYGGSEATIQAITYAITVLIVSCPCAIGLAVPMVVVIASGVAAERGVIFKSADAMEVAYRTSHVVFDKTGTLTQGKLSVVQEECVEPDKLPVLLELVENSQHPVPVAVAAHLKNIGITTSTSTVPDLKSLTGKGVEATLRGQKLQAGNSRWLNLSDHKLVQPMLLQGYTVFCFTINKELQAVYGLKDQLRPDAAETVNTLQKRGVSVHLVSGDDDKAVQSLASKLCIPSPNVCSRSSPADKKDYVQSLLGTATDRKKPIVVFCGDGTNDAVALAQATIGVHMNEGTDVAQSAADVVLLRPTLTGILTMMDASRKSVRRIKFNFGWSFVYNTFALLLAAGAFVNARIPPEFAGLGELVSVLPVIAAAFLLRWSRI